MPHCIPTKHDNKGKKENEQQKKVLLEKNTAQNKILTD
jgi:hypothetical protein